MARGLSKEEITAIFDKVYKELNIDVNKVPYEEYPFSLEVYKKRMRERANWSKRYFRGQAFSEFNCGNPLCIHSWSSVHASCILDLKLKEVSIYFWQECSESHKDMKQLSLNDSAKLHGARVPDHLAQQPPSVPVPPQGPIDYLAPACPVEPLTQLAKPQGVLVYPTFDEEAMTKMITWAAKLFKVLIGEAEYEKKSVGDTYGRPHLQQLCEVCQILGRACFERKPKN